MRKKYKLTSHILSAVLTFIGLTALTMHYQDFTLPWLYHNGPEVVTNTVLSPTPSVIPTPTPSPTPTLSPAQVIANKPLKADDDVNISKITLLMTSYLNAYYSADFDDLATLVDCPDDLFHESISSIASSVDSIDNIKCYYKESISDSDFIVYTTYDIKYSDNYIPVPTFEEYCISFDNNDAGYIVLSTTDETLNEALYLTRKTQEVAEISISNIIQRYKSAYLNCDIDMLSASVTDSSYFDISAITQEVKIIDTYSDYEFMFYSPSLEEKRLYGITEFDYMVFVDYNLKFINVETPIPNFDFFLIKMNEQNFPVIFIGTTSETTDSYIELIYSLPEIQEHIVLTNQRMLDAVESDSNLKKYYDFFVPMY